MSAGCVVAIDVGGTFTDLVAYLPSEKRSLSTKSLTTYDDFGRGIFDCIRKLALSLEQIGLIKHGTTLVINSLIQRKGAKTALLTTRGFRDALEIGRGNRPLPFDLGYRRHPPLIERKLRFELGERIDAKGEVLRPVDETEVMAMAGQFQAAGIEAIAISFLNAYANPASERRAAELLRYALPDVYVTTGTELSAEWHEYERTATAAANAYVGPLITQYLGRLRTEFQRGGCRGPLMMMGSNGGVLTAEGATRAPLMLVESGPIGGCIGVGHLAAALGFDQAIAFDMGGTTAKCAVTENNVFAFQSTYFIGGYEHGFPVRAPVIDIVEVGAGGGSIGWIDPQKRLHVGPQSAGSTPGPVCYGRGGEEPTITDANLLLGRLDPVRFLGGEMPLDVRAAQRAMASRLAGPLGYDGPDSIEQLASGLVRIAVTTMAGAIRDVTIRRGKDSRDFVLIAYGGGGPLHAVELARELDIRRIVIPPDPGIFSAAGMLMADLRSDRAATYLAPLGAASVVTASVRCRDLEREIAAQLAKDVDVAGYTAEWRGELRYVGQHQSLSVVFHDGDSVETIRAAFVRAYVASFGHEHPKSGIEFVGVRVNVTVGMERAAFAELSADGAPKATGARDVYSTVARRHVVAATWQRAELRAGLEIAGPALVEEFGSTTFLDIGDRLTVGRLGELQIDCALNGSTA
ncbi:MAG: hydantoinase/oxoprolinase family protein [Proteobacteria bacterium]|nr:hydantoinase/oxoprolinase family protein [Pseudomonadota bacterium]